MPGAPQLQLISPAEEHLASYIDALRRGWSPDNLRPEAAQDELARIENDSVLFLSLQTDRDAKAPPVVLPDGMTVPRLPGFRRWMWDGEFCGMIGFRWQPGTSALPPHCLGHIGYSVVPWKRGRGYATRALELLLPEVKQEGLEFVDLTTDPDNVPSRRVIESNGGFLVKQFRKSDRHGGAQTLLYRISLA